MEMHEHTPGTCGMDMNEHAARTLGPTLGGGSVIEGRAGGGQSGSHVMSWQGGNIFRQHNRTNNAVFSGEAITPAYDS
jgi:hypothetical protein